MSLYSFRVIFTTAVIAMLLAPLIAAGAKRIKLLDQPRLQSHKQHSHPMPVAGGLVLLTSLLTAAAWQRLGDSATITALLASSSLVFLFGLWDDLRDVPPWAKLTGQILAALLLVRLGVQVQIFQQAWLNLLFTLLWLVGITNAFNFVDSMDGLALGLASLAAAFLMLVTYDAGQSRLSLLCAALLGTSIASYYYNSPPALFFLGDSGAQFLGFLLAGLAIAYNPPGFEQLASWYVPVLLMGVPIFDTTLVVISRLRRGLPVYRAGLDHTYHRLVKLGFSTSRAVLTMQMAALLLGCLAFIALSLRPLAANLIFTGLLLTGAALLLYLERTAP